MYSELVELFRKSRSKSAKKFTALGRLLKIAKFTTYSRHQFTRDTVFKNIALTSNFYSDLNN